ncbi:MAG: AsnC family transcriptional regulator, partial [Candidatus Lokiarchaeota archaeon]|nr:AsnC family transcriptional regulator [Candidatus Lokiarchaeota archaeon]
MSIQDKKNREIIELLMHDGRASYSRIAEKIGLSESTVRKRVKKMIRDNIIERFTMVLKSKDSKNSIISFLTIESARQNIKITELSESIVNFSEVEEAYYLSGKCGILAKVSVGSLSELDELIDRIRKLRGVSK